MKPSVLPWILALCLAGCARRVPPSAQALAEQERCLARLAAAEYAAARATCQAATGLSASLAPAWQAEGIALLFLGKASEAQEALERARALDDRQWRTHNGLGIVAFVAKDHAKAEGYFKRAQELAPTAIEPRFNRVWNFFRWEKHREAKALLQTLMKENPRLGYLLQFYAVLLLTEEKIPAATEAMIAALEHEPRECRNWLTIGHAYYRDHRYLEAEDALRTCAELCPRLAACGAALESAEARELFPLAEPRDLLP